MHQFRLRRRRIDHSATECTFSGMALGNEISGTAHLTASDIA
jgi:hypothetical protein